MAKVKIGNVFPPDEYLLQRCAPAGYGYGETMYYVYGTESELETKFSEIIAAMEDGTTRQISFTCSDGTLYSMGRFKATIFRYEAGYAHICAETYRNYAVMKTLYDGAWNPVEWVNPPMRPGEEYRTTERWNGKPVYRKLVVFTMTEATGAEFTVPHGISNFGGLVRQNAVTQDKFQLPYIYDGKTTWVSAVNDTNIVVSNTGLEWDSSYSWNFDLYYTKTTD